MNKKLETIVEDTIEDEAGYTVEGLMNDFPTARDLEQFVYTQTNGNVSLNLKGRSNQLKYNLALDALGGKRIPKKYLSDDNPYLEKQDLVPQEEMRPVPSRHKDCPPEHMEMTRFNTSRLPHPDAQEASQNHCCDAIFKSYSDGTTTYEIIGPVNKRNEGQRLNKFGQMQPAIIRWIDPRTGENVLQYPNGQFSPVGAILVERLKNLDGQDVYTRYIKRSLSSLNSAALKNPWNLG